MILRLCSIVCACCVLFFLFIDLCVLSFMVLTFVCILMYIAAFEAK